MRFSRTIIFSLILSLLSVGMVAAQDADDFDLPILENGDSVSGVFTDTQDTQIFAFFGSEGDSITLHMRQVPDESPLDPLLIVINAEGRVIAADDDGAEAPFYSAKIEGFSLPEDGLYFVIATHNGALINTLSDQLGDDTMSAGLEYELDIRGITTPDNDDFPPLVSLNNGEAIIEINETTPVSLLTLTIEDARRISIATAAVDGEVDTILWLFAPGGMRIGLNDDADGAAPYSLINSLPLEEEGTYIVIVTGYLFEQTSNLDFDWEQDGIVLVVAE